MIQNLAKSFRHDSKRPKVSKGTEQPIGEKKKERKKQTKAGDRHCTAGYNSKQNHLAETTKYTQFYKILE